MDDNGDFAVTWTSYGQDGGGNGPGAGVNGQNGVYVQRYDSTGRPSAASSAPTRSPPATSSIPRSR